MISSLELARLCEVSQGTVDRALHQRAGISKSTRDRILKTAAIHGYRPHPAARELITGTSLTVQAILPSFNNIFFMDLVQELGKALEDRGFRLQIVLVRDSKGVTSALEDAAARRCRMAVIIPPEDGLIIPKTFSIPIVSLISPCRGENVSFISPDEETTGEQGVQYLYSMGHRDILFLTSDRKAYAIAARCAGYQKAMKRLKLFPRISKETEPAVLLRELRESGVTALFCHNDWLALKMLIGLREQKFLIPEELSILGVDNTPTFCALFPELTSLAYPRNMLVRSILAKLEGKDLEDFRAGFAVAEGTSVADRTKFSA